MCLPLRSMANIWFFLNFDNYCMGPSVRQLIAMMVPSVYELISHIYFVSCIKYVYDWKIKYLSIYLSMLVTMATYILCCLPWLRIYYARYHGYWYVGYHGYWYIMLVIWYAGYLVTYILCWLPWLLMYHAGYHGYWYIMLVTMVTDILCWLPWLLMYHSGCHGYWYAGYHGY